MSKTKAKKASIQGIRSCNIAQHNVVLKITVRVKQIFFIYLRQNPAFKSLHCVVKENFAQTINFRSEQKARGRKREKERETERQREKSRVLSECVREESACVYCCVQVMKVSVCMLVGSSVHGCVRKHACTWMKVANGREKCFVQNS